MNPVHNNISYHLLRVDDEHDTLLNGSHTLSQVILTQKSIVISPILLLFCR